MIPRWVCAGLRHGMILVPGAAAVHAGLPSSVSSRWWRLQTHVLIVWRVPLQIPREPGRGGGCGDASAATAT